MKQMHTAGNPRFYLIAGLLLCLLFLAACGNSGGTVAGGGSTVTPVPGGTATTGPTQGMQNCGSVHSIRQVIIQADKNQAPVTENCFAQAYQHCQSATLVYSASELDTSTIHNFSLKSVNGTCTISDYVQHEIAPHPPQVTGTYTCSSMTMQSDGLHILACGQVGNVVVPLS